ncbi:MAG: DUF3616 domain-containing protein [Gammaproteobacteria bacterium]
MASANAFLLSRVLLQFSESAEESHQDIIGDLSAVALTPDGSLWLASDECLGVERLSPIAAAAYGRHRRFPLQEYVDLFNLDDEIDIEGLDSSDNYLWFTGSHSTKRKKAKGKADASDIERIETIKTDANRYLLGRVPVVNGELYRSYPSQDSAAPLVAATLEKTNTGNVLTEALRDDPHLGPFIKLHLPSKDNGLDIEGLAASHDRLFLGLRGPVLRGAASILELEVQQSDSGVLTLRPIGPEGQLYRKHFLELTGLGVRDLCLQGEDLIILAGPTMQLEGIIRAFRLRGALSLSHESFSQLGDGTLELLFDLPLLPGFDHGEGISLCPMLGVDDAVLVVYDDPAPQRFHGTGAVYADVFRLP